MDTSWVGKGITCPCRLCAFSLGALGSPELVGGGRWGVSLGPGSGASFPRVAQRLGQGRVGAQGARAGESSPALRLPPAQGCPPGRRCGTGGPAGSDHPPCPRPQAWRGTLARWRCRRLRAAYTIMRCYRRHKVRAHLAELLRRFQAARQPPLFGRDLAWPPPPAVLQPFQDACRALFCRCRPPFLLSPSPPPPPQPQPRL